MSKGPKSLNVNLVTCPTMLLGTYEELEITKGVKLGTITKGVEQGENNT
jgi:hypothetical protein